MQRSLSGLPTPRWPFWKVRILYVTDTPDFFRRQHAHYPEHGNRFTGEPAYFTHVTAAATHLLSELGRTAQDYNYAIFHQPNLKFPQTIAKELGFSREQIAPGLLVGEIGNTYSGSSLIGLSATLDVAKPGDRILLVSFGSGAGSDVFSFIVSDAIRERQRRAPSTRDYIARRKVIDYAMYARYREKYVMN